MTGDGPSPDAYRIDLLIDERGIDERVVLEVKAVDNLLDIHVAQVIPYLRIVNPPPRSPE